MTDEIHWLAELSLGLIAWLLQRAIRQQDDKIGGIEEDMKVARKEISDLEVGVTKALSGNDALAEQIRTLRHDVREVKQGVDGIAHILMQGKR